MTATLALADLGVDLPGVEDDSETAILDRARRARQQELDASAALLVAALDWAHTHPCPAGGQPAGWGEVDLHGEGIIPLAGPGAPLVAEFAPATFAAHLGLSLDAGRVLIGDAVELAHRLPRLWQLTCAAPRINDRLAAAPAPLPAWRARMVARSTRHLDETTVDQVDRWLSQTAVIGPDKVTTPEIERAITFCRAHVDPDHAEAKAVAERDHRHVTLIPRHRASTGHLSGHLSGAQSGAESGAVTEVSMLLDTPDAEMFDNTIAHLATTLGVLGDTDNLDLRRAKAVGVLADPQRALDLLGAASGGRDADVSPHTHGSAATLYVHLTAGGQTAGRQTAGRQTVSDERHGALTLATLREWLHRIDLTGGRLTVRPVIDYTDPTTYTRAVDAHDPPAWMREAALLRDATCLFPGCTRDSRHSDLDHRTPYLPPDQGGPPAQTTLNNLGPLCRNHHRLKTHHGWTWQRTSEHLISWTTPDGDVLYKRTHRRRH